MDIPKDPIDIIVKAKKLVKEAKGREGLQRYRLRNDIEDLIAHLGEEEVEYLAVGYQIYLEDVRSFLRGEEESEIGIYQIS